MRLRLGMAFPLFLTFFQEITYAGILFIFQRIFFLSYMYFLWMFCLATTTPQPYRWSSLLVYSII